MRSMLILAALALPACNDQGFTSFEDPNAPGDTDDPGGGVDTGFDPDAETCEEVTLPAVDVMLNDACDRGPQIGSFTPEIELRIPGNQGYGPPVVGQLDDDNADGVIDRRDTPEICWIRNNYRGLICVDGQTGAIEIDTTAGRGTLDGLSGLALGDLDRDGAPEIIVSNGPTEVIVLDNTGVELWSVRGLRNDHSYFTYPAVADMDADGSPEVIVGRVILSAEGDILGTGAYGVGAVPNAAGSLVEGSVPAVVDLNGDGELEVVTGNAAYRMDGSALFTNGLADGCPAVADFDLDGEPEIVTVSGNTVRTLESDLTPTGWSDVFASNYIGPPAVDDLDGDGRPEFVVQAANEMRAYRWDGSRLWTAAVQDRSGAAGVVLFDFEMDGFPEVVYADEVSVRIFDGRDGRIKLESREHASATGFETPVVADVDNDDEVEIVMLHGQYTDGLTVYGDRDGTWPPGRQVWNQHAYSITSIEDDLSVPMGQEPNWARFNNFRSGDAGQPPARWDDVQAEVVDVCTLECPDDLVLLVRVRNMGTEDVPPGLPLAVRAGDGGPVVATAAIAEAIPSGRSSEAFTIRVASDDLLGEAPWVEADIDLRGYSTLAECDETNNAVVTDRCE